MYRLANNGVVRVSDGAFIPESADNVDWQRYLKWVSGGGVPELAVIVPTVIASVSARQARLALDAADLLETIESALGSLPKSAQIEWEYAHEIRRDSPLIAAVASALSLSDAQIDGLFAAAAEL